uniref:Cytochrome b5 heme-binding domain-containing protein n=1 Tax=Bos taurus TaxID=9913 RepID=A0A3Q1NDB1_BOVIN
MTFEEKPEGNGSLVDENQLDLGAKHQANGKPAASVRAKLPARQEAKAKCSLPRKSLSTYTWQEIQRHNQETDQWLVINRKVYDVTGWADRHPGGRLVLNHCAGEDATDVFRAMHPDPDIVRLYLKPLLIGELAPEEPNQERNKNSQLVEDFQELRRTLETLNMFNANLGFFFLHLAQVLILEALAWVIVWHFGSGWLITIFISFLLTVAQAQGSFLQHDTGHLCIFKKPKWNRLMQKFVMSHLKGISAKWWNNRHFQHHVKPNIYSKDPDIDVGPFFVIGDLQPVKYGKNKIKFINYEKQHLYFHVCESPGSHNPYHPISSKQTIDIAWVSTFYIRHFITFGPFYGIFGTMVLIYLVKLLESLWVENQDWFSSQVLTTCNVEQSFFNDWFTGHLNFQTEHHLFPTMPRHNYHKVAPLVKSLCAKHGLPYVNKPILKAFGDVIR